MLQEVLYGIKASDADRVAEQIGAALALQFEKHRSAYWGDYCLYPPTKLRRSVQGKIRVYYNHDPMHRPGSSPAEEQFFEPRFSDYGVLLYAYLTADELERFRQGLVVTFPDAVLIRAEGPAEQDAAADRSRE
jgi:hypothetical protein